MGSYKPWQQVALVVFGALFLMFLFNALRNDGWEYWVYPIGALVGIGITLYDGPARKEKREKEAVERAKADEAELKRAQRMARREEKRRRKDGKDDRGN